MRYLKNTLRKYRKNEAERPTNQKRQARRKPFKLNDGKGLYLYINTSGGKLCGLTFLITANGKRFQSANIRPYYCVSLVEARQAAENARRLLVSGQDPSEAKQQEKRERQAAVSNTFRNIAAEWHKHRETGLTGNHAARVWDSLGKDVFPALGSLSIREIKVSQVKEVIEAVAARGHLKRRADIAAYQACFHLCDTDGTGGKQSRCSIGRFNQSPKAETSARLAAIGTDRVLPPFNAGTSQTANKNSHVANHADLCQKWGA